MLFVIISMTLTYFLLYDIKTLERFIWNRQSDEDKVIIQEERKLPNFYQASQLESDQVFKPFRYIYRSDQATELMVDLAGIYKLEELILKDQLKVNQTDLNNDPKFIEELYSINHLQLQFADQISLGMLPNLVKAREVYQLQWKIDQVIYPLDGSNKVYMLNTATNDYVEVRLGQALDINEIDQIYKQSEIPAILVQGYIGNRGMIYLPDQSPQLSTKVYTLEKVPESLYLTSFSEIAALKKSDTIGDKVIYYNYLYNLEFVDDKQILQIRVNRNNELLTRTMSERYINSFTNIRRYEYWQGPIRLMGSRDNLAIYRRFLGSFPIFTDSTLVDYGASKVHMRNNDAGDIFRYQIPLFILQAHLPDLETTETLETAVEIFDQVKDAGYSMAEFDNIFVAYQWQKDMETNKKVELVPKWFIQIDDSFYSFDKITSPAFEEAMMGRRQVEGGN